MWAIFHLGVGSDIGREVGILLGWTEGCVVGKLLGRSEGRPVGCREGRCVGRLVGYCVECRMSNDASME